MNAADNEIGSFTVGKVFLSTHAGYGSVQCKRIGADDKMAGFERKFSINDGITCQRKICSIIKCKILYGCSRYCYGRPACKRNTAGAGLPAIARYVLC